ncbi:MAG TPA: MmgE/PrpD family protein [Candidatus Dormibacteraeota bacterium]|nr:MmgE/PrpD family protein [Candidatus Dormibacteraeota bacterium]
MGTEKRAPNEKPEPQKLERIADWAVGRRFEDIAAKDVPYLKVLVLDTLACAIGALGREPIEAVRGLTSDLGGAEWCSLVGGGRTSPDRAAFVNGALVRYLDFMDIMYVRGQSFHPSDNFAAVLAASEVAGASGRQLLTALAVAYQVQANFSERAPLQNKGFDHVSHLPFSIPAAVANALGLDRRVAANALAMCACSTTNLWVVRTGLLSRWKGFASAQAAMACMHMTLLATRGMTGPLNLMEGPQGWEDVVGERVEIDWPKEKLDRFTESSIKRYNAEGHTQSVLECLLEMRGRHNVRAEDVERVEVDAVKQVLNIVGGGEAGDRAVVRSKEQGDHSLPYMCAVALLDGDVWPEQFQEDRLSRSDVQELMKRVWIRQRDDLSDRYPKELPCRVRIELRDGRQLEGEKSDFLGFGKTRRRDWDGVLEKFERLTGPLLDSGLRRDIPQAVSALDSIQVSELASLLGRAGPRGVRATA